MPFSRTNPTCVSGSVRMAHWQVWRGSPEASCFRFREGPAICICTATATATCEARRGTRLSLARQGNVKTAPGSWDRCVRIWQMPYHTIPYLIRVQNCMLRDSCLAFDLLPTGCYPPICAVSSPCAALSSTSLAGNYIKPASAPPIHLPWDDGLAHLLLSTPQNGIARCEIAAWTSTESPMLYGVSFRPGLVWTFFCQKCTRSPQPCRQR